MSGEAKPGTSRLSEQNVPELDGVRGFALVMVMAYHCLYFETTGPISGFIEFLRSYGWVALDLFFVLSGYLISGILLDMRDTRHRIRNFYARRALRILPLYYLSLLLFFNLLPLAVTGRVADGLEAQRADQAYYWLYVQNWLFAWRGHWPIPPDINHLWSLNVEEQFYLVWPLVVYGMGRVSMMRLCVFLMVTCVAGRIWLAMEDASWVTVYVSTLTRMDSLAVGSWLAGVARSAGGIGRLERFVLPVGLSGLAIAIGLYLWRGIFHPQDVYCQTIGLTALSDPGLLERGVSDLRAAIHPRDGVRSLRDHLRSLDARRADLLAGLGEALSGAQASFSPLGGVVRRSDHASQAR
jgi:peptidoglycan/LPS O-acetylase OafA/YrhL